MPFSNPLERLILPPGIKEITPTDALKRMSSFLKQVPDLKFIIIVGREGDTSLCHCRPSLDLPDSRIREMLRVALVQFDRPAEKHDEHERLIQIPGMRHLSLKEGIERIQSFVNKSPGMTLVLLLSQQGSLDKIRKLASSNLNAQTARETIRTALAAFDKRGLPPPAA